jgi:nitroimidazol reductase NimA-like FMN-containing flavoprotein (pyridoxamine 5'-phosphate oxidase superfamily)
MFGEMKKEEIEALLESQIVGRLACCVDSDPYIVPMSYAYDGEYIYGHSNEGTKIQIMRKNPKICFQVDKMENMANWQSVIVWGEYEELTSATERNLALKILMERVLPIVSSETVHLSPHWPFPPQQIGSIKGIVFRIKIEKMTGRFEKSDVDTYFAS